MPRVGIAFELQIVFAVDVQRNRRERSAAFDPFESRRTMQDEHSSQRQDERCRLSDQTTLRRNADGVFVKQLKL